MYNGWTNWETWVTVTWLDDLRNLDADKIQGIVEEMLGEHEGFLGQVVSMHIQEVNFDEIAKSFAPEEYEIEDDLGYECDVCGDPAPFYNGDTDEHFCEDCN